MKVEKLLAVERDDGDALAQAGLELNIPPPELCTDNAAMIASAARYLQPVPYPEFLGFDAFARAAA